MKFKRVDRVRYLNYSGYKICGNNYIIPKRHQYFLEENISIPGDAPKDLIRLYEYGCGVKKMNPKTWSSYLAKFGNKWYPSESVTEYIISQVGKHLKFHVAEGRLALLRGQLRFLSKNFIPDRDNWNIEHGIDLIANYLSDDSRSFVEQVANKDRNHEFFTIQFIEEVLKNSYPNQFKSLFYYFIEMIVFDCIVGNNDRHHANWALLVPVHENPDEALLFAPVYDTARGLFWNLNENNLIRKSSQNPNFIEKYAENAQSKAGWEGSGKKLTHFQLLEKLANTSAYSELLDTSRQRLAEFSEAEFRGHISPKMEGLLTSERKDLIFSLLEYRIQRTRKILSSS